MTLLPLVTSRAMLDFFQILVDSDTVDALHDDPCAVGVFRARLMISENYSDMIGTPILSEYKNKKNLFETVRADENIELKNVLGSKTLRASVDFLELCDAVHTAKKLNTSQIFVAAHCAVID